MILSSNDQQNSEKCSKVTSKSDADEKFQFNPCMTALIGNHAV